MSLKSKMQASERATGQQTEVMLHQHSMTQKPHAKGRQQLPGGVGIHGLVWRSYAKARKAHAVPALPSQGRWGVK